MVTFSGTYSEYKAATSTFLDWLKQAAKLKNVVKDADRKQSIATISGIVDRICLSGDLEETVAVDVPKALQACIRAIRLRERASVFFAAGGETSDSNSGHQFFIAAMKKWYQQLQTAFGTSGSSEDTETEKDNEDAYANIFSSLSMALDDDDDDDDDAGTAPSSSSASEKKQKQAEEDVSTFNDFFDEDLSLRLRCFFYDAEAVMQEVFKAWGKCRKEECTLLTATAVSMTAAKFIRSLEAQIQLRYPALEVFPDFLSVGFNNLPVAKVVREMALSSIVQYQNRLPVEFRRLPLKELTENPLVSDLLNSLVKQDGLAFVRGALIAMLVDVHHALSTFVRAMPSNGTQVRPREGYFGPAYSESIAPYDPSKLTGVSKCGRLGDTMRIIGQEMPTFYNVFMYHEHNAKMEGRTTQEPRIDGKEYQMTMFYTELWRFFKTRKASFSFCCLIQSWLWSLQHLQCHLFMRRTLYLTMRTMNGMLDKLHQCLVNGTVEEADADFGKLLRTYLQDKRDFVNKRFYFFVRSNPLLAGMQLMEMQAQYLNIGCQALKVTGRFRALGHLYHGLVNRHLLEPIAFLDHLFEVFDSMVFYPSRPQHGGFVTCYQLSRHLTVAGIAAQQKGLAHPKSGGNKVRRAVEMHQLSKVAAILARNDYSQLDNAMDLDVASMVRRVGELAAAEQHESRVMGLDLLSINCFVKRLFEDMRDVLGRQGFEDEFVASEGRNITANRRQYLINGALEESVMNPIIVHLDAIRDDGSFDMQLYASVVKGAAASVPGVGPVEIGRGLIAMCKDLSNVIDKAFRRVDIDREFYFLPNNLVQMEAEFGSWIGDLRVIPENGDTTRDTFHSLLDMLEAATTKLDAAALAALKERVKREPGLLYFADLMEPGPQSLIQHASYGAIADVDLTHWLACMGGLDMERCGNLWDGTFYTRKGLSLPPGSHTGTKTVHRLAIAGKIDALILCLEFDNSRDINTRTATPDGDTLLHLALRHGHSEIASYLEERFCEMWTPNRHGKLPYEVAVKEDDRKRYQKITDVALDSLRASDAHVPQDKKCREEDLRRTEDTRRAVEMQRRDEAVSGRKKPPRGGTAAAAPPLPPSFEEVARAEAAAKALMRELEDEENNNQKKVGGSTRANGGKKKKHGHS